MFRIWTGDGSMIDGEKHETQEDAIESVKVWKEWDEVFTAEHCDGSAVSCYENQEDADNDADGAYATTVSDLSMRD